MSQFVPPSRPLQGISNGVLEIQLGVCEGACGAIETALDDISSIAIECEQEGNFDGRDYANRICVALRPHFERTIFDMDTIGAELDYRKEQRRLGKS